MLLLDAGRGTAPCCVRKGSRSIRGDVARRSGTWPVVGQGNNAYLSAQYSRGKRESKSEPAKQNAAFRARRRAGKSIREERRPSPGAVSRLGRNRHGKLRRTFHVPVPMRHRPGRLGRVVVLTATRARPLLGRFGFQVMPRPTAAGIAFRLLDRWATGGPAAAAGGGLGPLGARPTGVRTRAGKRQARLQRKQYGRQPYQAVHRQSSQPIHERISRLFCSGCLIGQRHFGLLPAGPVPVENRFENEHAHTRPPTRSHREPSRGGDPW